MRQTGAQSGPLRERFLKHHGVVPFTSLFCLSVSNPLPPVTLVPGGVQDGENDNGVFPDEEEDAIGKPSGENAADLGALAKTNMKQWISCRTRHRSAKFIE